MQIIYWHQAQNKFEHESNIIPTVDAIVRLGCDSYRVVSVEYLPEAGRVYIILKT